MKKLLALSLVLTSTVMFANGTDDKNPSASASGAAVIKSGDTFKVIYKSEKQSDVKVSILNDRNEVVFYETLNNTDGFSRPYNFSSLKEGDYTIAIEDESKRQLEKISYRTEKAGKILNVLKVASEEGKFLVMAAGTGSETITINIYDGARNLVHRSTQNTKGNFAQLYNLKNVKGHLTFEIANENGDTKYVSY